MRPSVKYQAIYVNEKKYGISFMCQYFGVSRSGYYAWRHKRETPDRDAAIGDLIQQCQRTCKSTYGYRRVKLWLQRNTGLIINHKAVLRIMRKYNLLAEIRRPRPLYRRQRCFCIYTDLLSRDFRQAESKMGYGY